MFKIKELIFRKANDDLCLIIIRKSDLDIIKKINNIFKPHFKNIVLLSETNNDFYPYKNINITTSNADKCLKKLVDEFSGKYIRFFESLESPCHQLNHNICDKIFSERTETIFISFSSAQEGYWIGKKFVLEHALTPQQGICISSLVTTKKQFMQLNLQEFLQSDIHIGNLWILLLNNINIGIIYNIFTRNEQSSDYYTDVKCAETAINTLTSKYLIPRPYLDKIQQAYTAISQNKLNDMLQLINKVNDNNCCLKRKANILLVAPDFEIGGGQILVVRIANYLSTYHNVYLYNARPMLTKSSIKNMVEESVHILKTTGEADDLYNYIVSLHIDVINTHIWWSDKLAYYALNNRKNVKWVLCMHGCYEALLDNPDWDNDFAVIAKEVLQLADFNVYVTPKNLRIFSALGLCKDRVKQIYTGYERQAIPPINKKELNIPEESTIFGIVSRAIPEKGWEQAIQATIKLNQGRRADLVLVGSGDYADNLRELFKNYDFIHIVDASHYPSEWIGLVKIFDVAMLPSYFISESLPNAIIEYLAYNKPVIATDIGEIRKMLCGDNGECAGIIISLDNGILDTDLLYEAMKKMQQDQAFVQKSADVASKQYEQFEMSNFINQYCQLYFN